jgi:hypothetical protein
VDRAPVSTADVVYKSYEMGEGQWYDYDGLVHFLVEQCCLFLRRLPALAVYDEHHVTTPTFRVGSLNYSI